MAHLQLHNAKSTASAWAGESGGDAAAEGCLGALLIDFFELFGRRINTDEVGPALNPQP
jgi:non-canonical poly(A) RNA polymerase PAPD5/7